MERIRHFIMPIILSLMLLTGCQSELLVTAQPTQPLIKPNLPKPTQAIPPDEVYNGNINIRGKIVKQINLSEFQVEGARYADTDFDKAVFSLNSRSLILRKSRGCSFTYAQPSDLHEGQWVEVTLNSPIQPTDPVKAEASQVVLLDPKLEAPSDPGPAPSIDARTPSIRGRITQVTERSGLINSILVAADDDPPTPQPDQMTAPTLPAAEYDRAYVKLFYCTLVYEKRGDVYIPVPSDQLAKDQWVDVLFFGPIGASYPVQARAMEVIIYAPVVEPVVEVTPPVDNHTVYLPSVQR